MIELHEVEGRMKRAKPGVTIEPDFTARVMAEVKDSRVRRDFTLWRNVAMAAAVFLVVVAGGAFAVMHHRASQTVADQTQKSQTQTSNPSGTNSAAHYQQLASSAQSDLDSMSQQTAKFTDNDYGDGQLADSAIF